VKFVEQHRGDTVEHRIVEDQPGENPLGDDFDPGLARHLRAEAHAKSDCLADALAERLGHPVGGSTRCDPARLEQENAASRDPRFVGQHQRHARRLAGARRRHQHGAHCARARLR
jgi:hypothetical protein